MTLVFKDKDNNTSSKATYNSISLKRSRILDLGTLAVTAPGEDPDVVTWHKGPAGKAPTLCVIADGFTAIGNTKRPPSARPAGRSLPIMSITRTSAASDAILSDT